MREGKKRLNTENTQIRHSSIYRVRVRDKANDLERKKKPKHTHENSKYRIAVAGRVKVRLDRK